MSRGAERNRSLDGLRGIAILLVVISHANVPVLKFGGAAGVTLFFVLSGYLITTLLVKEHSRTGTVHLGRFYARRALRLLPALVVALVGGTVLAVLAGQRVGPTLVAAGMGLFYVSNLWPLFGVTMDPFGQLWSLAMEEQYYLLWPVVLLALRRARLEVVFAGTLAVAAVSVGFRFATNLHTAHGYDVAYYLPHASVWALLWGSALALVLSRRTVAVPDRAARAALVGLLLVASVFAMRSGLREAPGAASAFLRLLAGPLAAACAVVLVTDAVTRVRSRTWVVSPVLLFFGHISYALYLWHGIIDHVLGERFGSEGIRGLAVGLVSAALAVGAAVLSGRYVERPFMEWKARLESGWRTAERPVSAFSAG